MCGQMVAHHAIGMAAPPLLVDLPGEQDEEPGTVVDVEEYGRGIRPAYIAPRRQVVDGATKIQSSRPNHVLGIARSV